MIELVKVGVDTLIGLLGDWITAPAKERAELEKRAVDAVAIMRGERQLAHEEIDARTAETRRILDEEKKRG